MLDLGRRRGCVGDAVYPGQAELGPEDDRHVPLDDDRPAALLLHLVRREDTHPAALDTEHAVVVEHAVAAHVRTRPTTELDREDGGRRPARLGRERAPRDGLFLRDEGGHRDGDSRVVREEVTEGVLGDIELDVRDVQLAPLQIARLGAGDALQRSVC